MLILFVQLFKLSRDRVEPKRQVSGLILSESAGVPNQFNDILDPALVNLAGDKPAVADNQYRLLVMPTDLAYKFLKSNEG